MRKSIVGTLVSSLCCWGIAIAQNNISTIPASVLPILQQAETHRLHFKHDSAFYSLRQAQRAYYQLNKPAEAVHLYPRLFMLSFELVYSKPLVDSFAVCMKELEQITKRQPAFKKDYLFSQFMWLDDDKIEQQRAIFNELMANTDPEKDWDYQLLPTFFMFDDSDSTYQTTVEAAYKLMHKHLPLASFKTAYLHSISSMLAFYIPYDMAMFQLNERHDYEQALRYFKEVTTRLESAYILDSVWYSTAFNSIARIYRKKGDLAKTRDYFEKAITYIPAHISHSHNHYNNHIAGSYLLEDNYKQAIKYALLARRADTNPKKSTNGVHNIGEYCWTLANLIEAYTRSYNMHEAARYVDTLQSLPIANIDKNDEGTQYDVYQALGLFNWRQGNIAKGRHYLELAGKIYPQVPAEILFERCELELAQAQPLVALDYIQQYLQRQSRGFVPTSAADNPTMAQITMPYLAIKGIQQKLKIWHQLYIAGKPFDAKANKIYYETALFGIELLQKVCRDLERESAKSSLVAISFHIYEHAINAAYQIYINQDKSYLDKIFAHIEQSKAFLLSSSLQESTARSFGGVPDSLIALEKELGINIQFYTQQQQDAQQRQEQAQANLYAQYAFQFKQRLDSLKQRLERDYPRYYELKYNQYLAGITDIQQQLDSRTALLSYFEGYDYLFVFEIEQNAASVRCIPRPSEYDKIVRNFRTSLTSPSLQSENAVKSFASMASQLYKWFIPNTLPNGIDRLLIIPDGSLNYVPFETFLTESDNSITDFQRLSYLIKKYNVSYHYSASLWQRQRQENKRPVNQRVLAMAASYEKLTDKALEKLPEQLRNVRKTLAPLSGTIQEIDFLKQHFAGLFLINQDATEANFKQNADKYGIVHLAMHGLVDEASPEYSSLAFTDAANSDDDNFLQAYEIKALTMNADLVVLSACETGYGKFSRGEGVISLGRGFMYNGTASLLMTLWAINDQTTPIIVEQFYQNLSNGLPKDEALRQAKLFYLQHHTGANAHPAFWAAFVQVGKVDNIRPATPTNWTLWLSLASGSLAAIGIWTWWKRRAA